jgi:hypothetical protein
MATQATAPHKRAIINVIGIHAHQAASLQYMAPLPAVIGDQLDRPRLV